LAIACSPLGTVDDQTGESSIGSTPLPCSVAQILQDHCYDCHGTRPRYGAPMSLVTWEDVQRPSKSNSAKKVFQQIGVRIDDQADIMPPPMPTTHPLAQGEKDHLHGWIAANAPAGDGCGLPPGTGGAGGSISSTGGTGNLSSTGGTGTGGSSGGGSGGTGGGGGSYGGTGGGPVDGSCQPVQFLAHGQQVPGDTTAFPVPAGQQFYEAFYFKVPWNVATQALRFTPIIDNDQVLHHWLLYASNSAYTDGTYGASPGVHSDGTLLAGWAPGAGEWIMPDGVGMELPSGNSYLVLEVHYNNVQGLPNMVDHSGVEICATSNLRPNTATVSWLGTEGILLAPNSVGTATGTCTPSYAGDITLLRYWPHMHKLGRGMKADITRAAGGVQNLFDDQTYSFDYQISYELNPTVILHPGDKITTTCTFQNTTSGTVSFGPATENEMCYNFVIAYPANALASAGLMQRSCML
jgi:hypothetical protein